MGPAPLVADAGRALVLVRARAAAVARAPRQDANQVQTQEQAPRPTVKAARPAAKEQPACPPEEGRAGRAGGEGLPGGGVGKRGGTHRGGQRPLGMGAAGEAENGQNSENESALH